MSIEYIAPQGGVNVTIYVTLTDENGSLVTGLTDTDMTCYYLRPLGALPTTINVTSLATPDAAHVDGGFVEVSAGNMPGLYRFDLPDTVAASGENFSVVGLKGTTTVQTYGIIHLDPMPSVVQGEVVADANNGVAVFETNLVEGNDDQYIDAFLLFRSGNNAGSVEQVTGYNGTTKFISVNPFPNAPVDGDEFVIINR